MPGRRLLDEPALDADDSQAARRRQVLRETLAAFEARGDELRARALDNVVRWRRERGSAPEPGVRVVRGDWGVVARDLTRAWGEVFAVLNMANAYVPGGGYVEGMAAQEENMFRRTDCHFHVRDEDMIDDRYRPEMTALLSARDGRVYLDVDTPRITVRGPEDRSRDDLGYAWLADDDVFPFHELRAAAQDLRGFRKFDAHEARRRIAAQLDTLVDAGLRHAVLSAFGCGAFENPADEVARIYRDELSRRGSAFDCVVFAIFDPGYGPDNATPFEEALSMSSSS